MELTEVKELMMAVGTIIGWDTRREQEQHGLTGRTIRVID